MNYRILPTSLSAALALSLFSAAARAEKSTNPAGAEALYEQARGLMKQGNFDQACPKFKQSYDLDPAGGTLLNLAECYEKQGKFASAWSNFKEALVQAQRDGRSERVEYAQKHLDSIEPKLAHVTIEVPSETNQAGLAVTLDGAPLGAAAWGVEMPVDPGAHHVSASAPGKVDFEKTLQIKEGSVTLKIPALDPASGASPSLQNDVAMKPVTEQPAAEGNSQRTAGYVIGGAGVVALGVGAYFGLHAMSKWNERKDDCAHGCTPDAKSAGDAAKSAALVSDIGFGIGLVASGVAGYLLLSAKSPSAESARVEGRPRVSRLRVSPALGPHGGGLVIGGSY